MQQKRILLVEDCPVQQEILMSIIDEGIMICAGTEKEALALADSNKFDLVILDIVLSLGNGFNVCRELRNRAAFKDTPILVVSGQTDIIERNKAFEAGANDYLIKPYIIPVLKSKIKEMLNQPRKIN